MKALMNCPSCGAVINVNHDITICSFCGQEFQTELKPIAQDVGAIKQSTDRTAAELAIVRLEREILAMNDNQETLAAQFMNLQESNRLKIRAWKTNRNIMLVVGLILLLLSISIFVDDRSTEGSTAFVLLFPASMVFFFGIAAYFQFNTKSHRVRLLSGDEVLKSQIQVVERQIEQKKELIKQNQRIADGRA